MKYPPPACIQCGAPRESRGTEATPPHLFGKCPRCRNGRTQRSWQKELAYAASRQPCRTPLQPDPVLWEAFAPDREKRSLPRIRPCGTCGRMTRPSGALIADYPDTIVRHGTNICSNCRSNQRRTS